jgi:hypothetical protein
VSLDPQWSTHEHPLWPMSPTLRTVGACWFELPSLENGEWPRPVGLLVGEQPKPGGNPKLPLWPFPKNSAGARLFLMSGMQLIDYFRLLARVNVSRNVVARWNANGARQRGLYILRGLPDGTRVVACGARARDALGVPDFFRPQAMYTGMEDMVQDGGVGPRVEVVAIPHPSGRTRDYNDPDNRKLAGSYVRWAARLR